MSAWKELLRIVGEQSVCHIGEPEYTELYAHAGRKNFTKAGKETPTIVEVGEAPGTGFGRYTQGLAVEYLAHVIFGNQQLDSPYPSKAEVCNQFLPDSVCPGSPCRIGGNHGVKYKYVPG